jgi:hypothetical protein
MNRALKSLLALMVTASVAAAQTAAPPPAPAVGTIPAVPADNAPAAQAGEPVPTPTPAPDYTYRSVSSGVAEALSMDRPKYNPPTPTPVTVDVPEDMRTVDKPKNDIPRLPSYIVRDSRPPVFRNRDLYTKDGLVSMSYKLHPGLGIGNLAGLNDNAAYQMFLDDERLANIADLTDTARSIAAGGDKAEGEYILQATQDTYMRPDPGFIWGGPGGGANGGGGGK